jgi:hypothetical protein
MIAAVIALLSLPAILRAQQCQPSAPFKVDTTIRDGVQLHITAINNTLHSVVTNQAIFPWLRPELATLEIVEPSTHTFVPQRLHFSDSWSSESFTIAPHKAVSGDVDLTSSHPTLKDIHRKADLIVFWAFRLEAPDRSTSQLCYGATFLPRGGNGSE